MIKQKYEEMIERHLRCSSLSESFFIIILFIRELKKCVRCSMFDDLLHFKAVDSVDTLLDSFLRRHEKLSGFVRS